MEIPDFLYSPHGRRALLLLILAGSIGAGVSCVGPSRPAQATDIPIERARVAAIREGERGAVDGVEHLVAPGQTLWRIARAYSIDPHELARANGIADPARIEVGQRLFIPGARVVRSVPPYPAPVDPAQPVPGPTQESLSADWIWPVRGELISRFGSPRRQGRTHRGIDIRGRHGDPVRAARGGRVTYSDAGMRGYGKTVILDHGDGLTTLYAHNTSLLVTRGQWVDQGEKIARVGRTGNATTEHCHFEIRRRGRAVDPMPFLQQALEARR